MNRENRENGEGLGEGEARENRKNGKNRKTRKPKEMRSTTHSVSCTALEWERMRERAREAGKPISRFLVERALTVDPGSRGTAADAPQELVLGAGEQGELHDNLAAFAALMSEQMFQDDPLRPNLPAMIRALFETRLDEMTRTGRYGEMKALLDEVIGPAESGRIANAAYERNLPGRGERD